MEILTRLNWVDILIIIVMLRISYVSFQDGLSHEIFPFIGTIATIVLTLRYYAKVSYIISQYLGNVQTEVLNVISFVGLIIVMGMIFKFVKVILDKIIKVTWHPLIEKFGGLIIGIGRAAVVTSIILIMMTMLPLSYLEWSIRDRSLMGTSFLKIVPAIYERVAGSLLALPVETRRSDKEKTSSTEKEKVPPWEKAYKN